MLGKLAPDLENGLITNGINSTNVWNTEIQSATREHKAEADEWTYLSHECRFEHVPFNTSSGGDGIPVFGAVPPFKFLTFSKDNVYYQIPSIDGVVDEKVFSSFATVDIGGALIPVPSRGEDWDSRVTCRMRDIHRMDLKEAHDIAASHQMSPRKIFLHVSFDNHGTDVELFFPCRYMNYSHPELMEWKYMQTISGYVLIPFGSSYIYGYTVVAENEEGIQRIEFVSPRYSTLGQRLAEVDSTMADASARMGKHYVPTFDFNFKINGTAAYYKYI